MLYIFSAVADKYEYLTCLHWIQSSLSKRDKIEYNYILQISYLEGNISPLACIY